MPYLTDRMGLELAKNGVVQIILRKGKKEKGKLGQYEINYLDDQIVS